MMRESGHTRRFHTVPTIGFQTVAEHSFHVAMLCIEMSEGQPSSELLKAALYHDLPEICTGDIPAHVKWKNADLKNMLEAMENDFLFENDMDTALTIQEELILKYADALELGFYCVDQLMLGNRGMREIYQRIEHHINSLPDLMIADRIKDRLKEKYHDATT